MRAYSLCSNELGRKRVGLEGFGLPSSEKKSKGRGYCATGRPLLPPRDDPSPSSTAAGPSAPLPPHAAFLLTVFVKRPGIRLPPRPPPTALPHTRGNISLFNKS